MFINLASIGFPFFLKFKFLLWYVKDKDGKVPFYWGTAADGCLTFSDTAEILKAGCGKSFAPFPPGK